MKVIRDAFGKVINIGDWDYNIHIEIGPDGFEYDAVGNPLPAGAVESDEEVIESPDGGLYVKSEYEAANAQ